jgi:hypothetical protein
MARDEIGQAQSRDFHLALAFPRYHALKKRQRLYDYIREFDFKARKSRLRLRLGLQNGHACIIAVVH